MIDRRISCDAALHPVEYITGDHCSNCGCSGPEVARCKPAPPQSDLISSLADFIIALINEKPQSPKKDEIEAVLKPWIDTVYMKGRLDGGRAPVSEPEEAEVTIVDPELESIGKDIASALEEREKDRAEVEQKRQAMRAWYEFGSDNALYQRIKQRNSIMPLPYKDVSTEMMQLMEFANRERQRLYDLTGIKPASVTQCPISHGFVGHPQGDHLWEAVPIDTALLTDVRRVCRCACGAVKP